MTPLNAHDEPHDCPLCQAIDAGAIVAPRLRGDRRKKRRRLQRELFFKKWLLIWGRAL